MSKLREYVLKTSVINRNIVDSIDEIGGGSDAEQWETLFDGEVTTESYSEYYAGAFMTDTLINNDTIKVTFDGTEYMCEKTEAPGGISVYGGYGLLGPDFSEYPFGFGSGSSGGSNYCEIYTETGGAHSIKIEAQESGGESSDDDEEQWETLFDDDVTTENNEQPQGVSPSAIIEYDSVIDANIIKVTFEGTEYMCEKTALPQANIYGGMTIMGPDFSEYPFGIASGNDGINDYFQLFTESAGTYSLKIEAQKSSGNSDFSIAEVEFILQDAIVSFPVAINAIIYGNMECFEGVVRNETFTIPLYQKCVKLWLSSSANSFNITTTGNVIYDDEEGALIVRGDGTVTVSNGGGTSQ